MPLEDCVALLNSGGNRRAVDDERDAAVGRNQLVMVSAWLGVEKVARSEQAAFGLEMAGKDEEFFRTGVIVLRKARARARARQAGPSNPCRG